MFYFNGMFVRRIRFGYGPCGRKRTVKVAFFPMSGYNEKDKDGSFTGMDVEYLKEVCIYANWDIEYVECESWDEALKLLKEKKLI